MWARERRVWASGGEAPASPGLVHTVRRTALGPKGASTSSPLGVARAVVVISTPLRTTEELARAGGTPPGHGRCSFAMRRGLPASNTLVPRRGAMQGSSAVRITPTGAVHSHATAPIRARPRAGRTSLAGTVAKATLPSRSDRLARATRSTCASPCTPAQAHARWCAPHAGCSPTTCAAIGHGAGHATRGCTRCSMRTTRQARSTPRSPAGAPRRTEPAQCHGGGTRTSCRTSYDSRAGAAAR